MYIVTVVLNTVVILNIVIFAIVIKDDDDTMLHSCLFSSQFDFF